VFAQCLCVIRLEQIEGDVWTIPGEKQKGRKDATMGWLIERREMAARPHGFRSSLRD
jgi:hypothetical protein